MLEVFHEETIGPIEVEKVNRKYKIAATFSILSLISAIFFTFYFLMALNLPIPEEANFSDFLIVLVPNLIFMAGVYTLYFVFRSKKNSYNVFYDYTFVSGELRIAKVLNGVKRKPVAKVVARDISVLGKVSSDNFLRYKSMKDLRNIVATPNVNVSDNVYFMVCSCNGERTLLLFEPSQTLLIYIKRFAGRTIDYV